MASRWQTRLARLSRMSADELRTRVGQELGKRADVALYRLGLPGNQAEVPVPSADHAGRTANFLFPRQAAPERARLLQTALPEEAAAIVAEAEEVCQHRFCLLGYERVDYAAEIDWHLDRIHQKRAPLEPWFTIPFLDFSVVGDHKIIWELNRHQHLVTLAKAFLFRGDERYSRELISQWYHWQRANPYPLGINWGSSLEVAFRSLSWIWVDHLLPESAATDEFRSDLRRSLAFHGRYIERFLSTYFSPNTHLLGEAVALFYLGTLYPGMARADRWRGEAWQIITREALRQVRPDGVYFEQSLHYHVYALDFFLYARLLAARNGTEIPAEFDAALNRMLDVVQSLSQAGPPEGFGDDDGGRVFNPRRNQTEHMTDPLAVGRLLYGRDDLSPAQLTEESIWLFGEDAVSRLSFETDQTKEEPHSVVFPDGGLYVLADTKPFPHAFVVDAGPQGVGRCGHGHADAISIRLTGGGRRWLIDPGSAVYIGKDQTVRDTFRGTAAHNTLRVDGVDQAVPADPFSWTGIPITIVDRWVSRRSFRFFAGQHDGYRRPADPVTHRRMVLAISDGPILVRDIAEGTGDHELELNWHLAPDLQIETRENSFVALSKEPAQSLQIVAAESPGWRHCAVDGEYSPAYGRVEPAPVIRSRARVRLPAETATILQLQSPAQARTNQLRALQASAHTGVQVYSLREEDALHTFLFSTGEGLPAEHPQGTPAETWHAGPWSSDAEVVYVCVNRSALTHLVMIGGTFLRFQDALVFADAESSPERTAWIEWQTQNGEVRSFSSNGAAPHIHVEAISPLEAAETVATETAGREPVTYAEKP